MIWIYRILFIPILLVCLPYYLQRMFKRGGYRKDFQHRFGLIRRIPLKKKGVHRIWLQAVSVGEVLAIGPLVKKLTDDEHLEIILTTTTSTAYRLALKTYQSAKPKVTVAVFPLDFWPFSAAAWNRIQPDLAVLMESELWPEHLHQARKRHVPISLINGRISDRSFRRYRRVKIMSRHLLRQLENILCTSSQDKERFIALGAQSQATRHIGSLKFDVEVEPRLTPEALSKLKHKLGFYSSEGSSDPLVILGSSTWPGEEKVMLEAFEAALEAGIDCRLLIVPRHAERRGELEALLKTQPRSWHLRSRSKKVPQPVMIHLADTTGDLKMLTQAADIAFIGKSLPPNNGGQTPIEAAAMGIPLIYGPNMNNFRQICQSLEEANAAKKIHTSQELKDRLIQLLKAPEERHALSIAARQWHQQNQGATERTLEILETLLHREQA